MSTHTHGNTLLTTREAARRLGLAAGTLQNWRIRGQGPAFVRLGKAIRYDEGDLARFIAQGRAAK
jgi:excisionase family DNA binding protein